MKNTHLDDDDDLAITDNDNLFGWKFSSQSVGWMAPSQQVSPIVDAMSQAVVSRDACAANFSVQHLIKMAQFLIQAKKQALTQGVALHQDESWKKFFEPYKHYHWIMIAFLERIIFSDEKDISLRGSPEWELNNETVPVNMGIISSILENALPMETLSIDKISIKDDGVNVISNMLCNNTQLKKLSFSDIGMSSKGAQVIADMLKNNSTLQSLHIFNEKCFDARDPSNMVIVFANVIKQHKSLQSVRLQCDATNWGSNCHPQQRVEAISTMIAENKILKELNLCGSALYDHGVSEVAGALAKNDTLEVLNLDCCGIEVEGVKAVASTLQAKKTLTLKHLSFKNNAVNAEGIEALKQLQIKYPALHIDYPGSVQKEREILPFFRNLY